MHRFLATSKTKISTPTDVAFVIDAGARRGIHPGSKEFGAPLQYYMFGPDSEHAPSLAKKYEASGNRVAVVQSALGSRRGRTDINVFRHLLETRNNYGDAMHDLAETGLFICARNSTHK